MTLGYFWREREVCMKILHAFTCLSSVFTPRFTTPLLQEDEDKTSTFLTVSTYIDAGVTTLRHSPNHFSIHCSLHYINGNTIICFYTKQFIFQSITDNFLQQLFLIRADFKHTRDRSSSSQPQNNSH